MHDITKFTPLQRAQIELTQARLAQTQLGDHPAVLAVTQRLVDVAQAKVDEENKKAAQVSLDG